MDKNPSRRPLAFFFNQKIGIKILTGYMVTVLLAAIGGGVAIIQLNQVNAIVTRLTGSLAQERALAEQMVVQIQQIRLVANRYIYQGQNPADLEAYNQAVAAAQTLLNLADRAIVEKAQAERLAQVRESFDGFTEAFAEIVQILAERQGIVTNVLNPQGASCVDQLAALRNGSFETLDFTSAHYASQARDTIGQAQLGVFQYLTSSDERLANRVDEDFTSINSTFDLLQASVHDDVSRDLLAKISAAATAYSAGFQQIRAGATRQHALVVTRLDIYGTEIDLAATAIANAVNDEFAAQSEATNSLVVRTRIGVLVTLGLAVLIGLVFGLALSRAITRPIEQMARVAQGIAGGDLDQGVQVQSSDELGTLAEALNHMTGQVRDTLTALQKWAHVFENSEWGITVSSADGKTFELPNPAFARMHGYSVEELTGQPLLIVFAPEVRADVPINVNLAHGKGHHVWESMHLRKDRSRFPVLMDVTTVRDDHGEILYNVINVQDITERKRAEEALRESERRYRNLFENASLAIFRSAPDGKFTAVNPEFVRMFGFQSPEEVMTTVNSANLFADPERRAEIVRLRAENPDLKIFENAYRRKDGGTFVGQLTVMAAVNTDGELQYFEGFIEDITERKRTEAALRASEEKYRLLFQDNPIPMWVYDRDSLAFLAVNDFAVDHYGYSREEFLGMTLRDIRPVEDVPYLYQVLQRDSGSLRKVHVVRHRRKDGSLIYVEITGHQLEFEGRPAMLILAQDITERERAEAALRESEEKFAKVFKSAPVLISITDFADGIYIDVNDEALRVAGFSRAEVIGHKSVELGWITPENRARLVEEIQSQGQIAGLEMDFRAKDGHTISGLVKGERVSISGRDCLLTVTVDITERRRAEEALRLSEAHYRQAIMAAGAVPYYRDYQGDKETYTFMGEGILQLTGYSATEITPAIFDQLEQGSIMRGSLAHLASDEAGLLSDAGEIQHWMCDYRLLTRDGQTRWVTDSAVQVRDENNRRIGVIGILQDITERKQAEDSIRESESLYRRMNENSPLGMHFYKLNANDQLIFIGYNAAANQLLGVDHAQFIGKTIETAFPPLAQTEVPQRYRDAAAKGILWSTEQIAYEDKQIRGAFEVRAFQTVPGNMVAVFADITTRKQAEEELKKYREHLEELVQERTAQLEAANKELEAFSYSVSHDLRTPLRAVVGFSRILQDEYAAGLPPAASQLLDLVNTGAHQMGRLIDDLLKFSRLGRHALKKQPIYPADLVRNALQTLSHEQVGRQVEISIGQLPACQGDPGLLLEVWLNLLSNALKYTRPREKARIEVGSQMAESGETVYYVRDNGVGFNMQYADKLFGVFQRLHSSEEFEGTGVGLALTQRIVTRHGGRIWAESELGQGATFYFTI
jgi:PAS domain S-box-containing protein